MDGCSRGSRRVMIEAAVGAATIRCWFDDLPPVDCRHGDLLRREVMGGPRSPVGPRRAALAVSQPAGPRGRLYGMLGGNIEPASRPQVSIEVVTCREPGERIGWAPEARHDDIRGGLVHYGHWALHGVVLGVEAHGLGSAAICLDTAAEAHVGSAPIVFEWLGASIVVLLSADAPPRRPTDLLAMLGADTSLSLAQYG